MERHPSNETLVQLLLSLQQTVAKLEARLAALEKLPHGKK